MSRLVMKFGGTSVANIDRIKNVARHVKREVDAGHQVAVVVSAMSGKTNELVAWTKDAGADPAQSHAFINVHDQSEYDVVVASGEPSTPVTCWAPANCGTVAVNNPASPKITETMDFRMSSLLLISLVESIRNGNSPPAPARAG